MTRSVSVRGWLALAIGSVALAVSAGAAQAQAPMVLKIATVNSGDNPRNISANEFARVVAEASKGKLKARSISTTSSRAAKARRSKEFSWAPSTSRRSAARRSAASSSRPSCRSTCRSCGPAASRPGR